MKKIFIVSTVILGVAISPVALSAAGVEDAYLKAKSCYGELRDDPGKATGRSSWERCIGLFEGVHDKYQGNKRGADALFSAGRLRLELYGKFKDIKDVQAAITLFNQLVREYPDSSLADDSLYQIGRLRHEPLKDPNRARTAFSHLIEHYPNGDMVAKAKEELEKLPEGEALAPSPLPSPTGGEGKEITSSLPSGGEGKEITSPLPSGERDGVRGGFDRDVAGPRSLATLKSIDITKGEGETTVSLMVSSRVAYSLDFKDMGPRTKSPPSLDVMLSYTKASPSVGKDISVASPHLSKIKMKKSLLEGGVRLFFEMEPGSSYEISSGVDRVVLHFKPANAKPIPQTKPNQERRKTKASIRERPFVVVIDPGHGGKDAGAIGRGGLMEKDVALEVSKELAARLKNDVGATVYLTRTRDKTLTLEDRNTFAVSKKADLFISIHANASSDRKRSGIETYFLNNASDKAAAKLARRENMAAKRKLSEVEHILSTMLQNYDAAESAELAGKVQSSLVTRMGRSYSVKNRRTRSALFYVLVGAKCPAILVETSFISNPREEKRLGSAPYRKELAISIADGVGRYVKGSDTRVGSL